ncbi:uncharacterized protein LOC130763332 [Actinidia eriantha]|uniref:uncharacterized protein LOC130763332 n=1 Tax=Actinidia eriantha TaxID=165200 RepID=UPI002588C655|nr:uncharacterized protein LOC130763332 [Actinidia eriantha]
MIREKMFRLHRHKSSAKSGERIDFTFSNIQALQVPKGWDKLYVSLRSSETGKTISKSGKATVRNGTCKWTETLSETIWISKDEASKDLQQYFFKLVVVMGSARSSILGEATINMAGYMSSRASAPVSLPLKKCNHGTILQVEIQCLTPRINGRDEKMNPTNSYVEDANSDSDDVDNRSEVSDCTFTKSIGSSSSNHLDDTFHPGDQGSRETSFSASVSRYSFDSTEGSLGRESFSPQSNMRGSVKHANGRQDSGSGRHLQNQRNDSGQILHAIITSPLKSAGSSRNFLETAEVTIEELRAEARMWEQNARKLILDQELLMKEFADQSKQLANLDVAFSAARTESDGLKQEIEHLKILLEESMGKQKAPENLKFQSTDTDNIQKILEDEIKFQKQSNHDLALQLKKTQDSNLELVSVLQEMEETIEKQKVEIENWAMLKSESVDTAKTHSIGHDDNAEVNTSEDVSAEKMKKTSCDSDLEGSIVGHPITDLHTEFEQEDNWNVELQLQQLRESQKNLESTILHLEKTLEDKNHEIAIERDLKARTLQDCETEWRRKLTAKEEEIIILEAKLSKAFSDKNSERVNFENRGDLNLNKEIEVLKEVQELERDCNELTNENLELLLKLKEASKDLPTNSTSFNSSSNECPANGSLIDSQSVSNFKYQICQFDKGPPVDTEHVYNVNSPYNLKCTELTTDKELAGTVFANTVQVNKLLEAKKILCEDNLQCSEIVIRLVNGNNVKNKLEGDNLKKDALCTCSHGTNNLIKELESRVADLTKELLAKTSQIGELNANGDRLLTEEEIEALRHHRSDLETQISDLQKIKEQAEENMEIMQRESDLIVVRSSTESHVSDNKVLERKSMELESVKCELELHVAQLEEENVNLSERISGLEAQLRYLTDKREASRLELQHSESCVMDLQADVRTLENEMEAQKVSMKHKTENMQKRWLEAQEECEYLKKANPKLQATAESLIEECSSLHKSNRELRQQKIELQERCTVLEEELKESRRRFSICSKKIEALEVKFSAILEEMSSKEMTLNSELDALHQQNKEYETLFLLAKADEVENLQKEVSDLPGQEFHRNFKLSQNKLENIQMDSETKILALMTELAASKEDHETLVANHEKLLGLLEDVRSNEDKLKGTIDALELKLRSSEYGKFQLEEEVSHLKIQLQKIPPLHDEVLALKGSLYGTKFENERLQTSLELVSGDYEELKTRQISLLQKMASMEKATSELENCRRSKVALEEKILRMEGDLTASEALCSQDAELKNELGRIRRVNSQFQWKMKRLEEEKEEWMKSAQALEEELKQKKEVKQEHVVSSSDLLLAEPGSCSTDTSIGQEWKRSKDNNECYDNTESSPNVAVDTVSRIKVLENELAEASETNDMYKSQLKSFLSEKPIGRSDSNNKFEFANQAIGKDENEQKAALLEAELREIRERYFQMSLKYAEVEAQREQLVMKLKAVNSGKRWFS